MTGEKKDRDESILDQILNRHPDKRHKPRDPEEALSRYTVENNRWDLRDFHKMLESMPELPASRQKLVDTIAGDVGYDEAGDMYWMLWKVDPEFLPDKEIRPTRRINRMVNGEAEELVSYQSLRRWTQGDDVGSALAFEKMEPDLEILYDRLGEQLKAAQGLVQKLQAVSQAEADQKSIEDIWKEWIDDEGDEESEEGEELQDARDEAKNNLNEAQTALHETELEVDSLMDAGKGIAREALNQGFEKAAEDFETMAHAADLWGMEPGTLHRLSAKRRLELAQRINSPKFRQMAKLFGAVKRLMQAEQKRKVVHSKEEIYGLELGNDPSRILPSELAKLDDPDMEVVFLKDFTERNLLQYEMKGYEKIAHGGIIYIHDGSGSMSGPREVWAKAIGGALLHCARKQKRSFYGIQFGSANQVRVDDFRDTQHIDPQKVVDFMEFFYGGGPLRADQRVATPNGWATMSSLHVGDQVIGSDGLPAKVLGVFPQGELDLYKVTFSDGIEVVCDGTHKWTVSRPGIFYRDRWETLDVNKIREIGLRRSHKFSGWQFRIPITQPLVLPERSLSVDPYQEGYRLGAWGSLRSDKYIRDEYLWASIGQRRALFAGLLDSNGFFVKPGRVVYSTISEKLADGVAQLAHSLGMLARISSRPGRLPVRSTVDRTTLYSVDISLNDKVCPFRAGPIAGRRYKKVWKARKIVRSIISIERVEPGEAICIKVDNDHGLFLTEGMAVTHNTNFESPLKCAIDILNREHVEFGAVRSDIVFATDGYAPISDEFMKEFKELQRKLEFKVYGVLIDNQDGIHDMTLHAEPLRTLCDGNVATVKSITSGRDARSIFRAI